MERNRQRVIDFYNEHKGELLLVNGNHVKRLIALCEDDSDYYYVEYYRNFFNLLLSIIYLIFVS